MSELDRTVERCVAHITGNAVHYFDVVRRSPTEGILWMVFTAAGGGNTNTDPIVKRVSFLPLETVAQTNAPSLLKMCQTCLPETQFVAWFTVEASDSSPMVSKVMIVEAAGTLPTPDKETTEHAWRLRAGQAPVLPNPVTTTTSTPEVAPPPPAPTSLPAQEAYHKVLRVSMAVADSAAQMGKTLDSVTVNVASLQKESVAHAAMLQEVLKRLDALENKTQKSTRRTVQAPVDITFEEALVSNSPRHRDILRTEMSSPPKLLPEGPSSFPPPMVAHSPGSLTDMIRSMEEKLSKIKVPGGVPI